MAALIAQIARQHHERKVRLKQTYPIEKSRYNLPPFEDSFQPKRDVKYLRWRPKFAHKQKIEARVAELVAEEVKKRDFFDAKRVTKCGMICEIIIIILSISLVPFLVMTVYLIWPV